MLKGPVSVSELFRGGRGENFQFDSDRILFPYAWRNLRILNARSIFSFFRKRKAIAWGLILSKAGARLSG